MVIHSWILNGIILSFIFLLPTLNGRIDDASGKDIIVTGALNAGGFITTEKKAQLSGLRVETEAGEEGFIGYTERGVSIVHPDIEVRIVLFGWWLDEVQTFGFTLHDNCSLTPINVSQADFTIQTEKRVVIKYMFESTKDLFKICMKQKPRESKNGEMIEQPYLLVDDLRTSISTDIPPRKYYFHMGVQIAIITVLLVCSGLFSGLNLGLMALTPQELMLISNSGSPQERRYAQTILPIRKSGNMLLCSLLIGNVCVNSAISILFDDLTSGTVALVVSSAGIVVFGEIVPQSVCVKKGLAVGAKTAWVTRLIMILTYPLSWPISKILDCVLGDEVVSYDRKRLMELIKMSTRNEDGLAEELKIAVGAMEISDKTVSDVMTKMNDVFMLPSDTTLNTKTVAEILRMGYTRIPVFECDRNNIVSLLFVKDLALLDPDDNFTVKTVCGYHEHALRFVLEDTPLRVMLEEFKKGEYHLAMVQRIVEKPGHDPVYEVVGVVTLEDIVEEILQAEIVDETDAITDNVHRIKRRRLRDDYTHFLDAENSSFQISMQMQFVTIQWLTANLPAFTNKYINRNVIEKIIQKNVHKVEYTNLSTNDTKVILPRQKIYRKKELSDKFILILEGRMLVTIGQNEMNFEAGPWHAFGTEILDKIVAILESKPSAQTTGQIINSSTTPPLSASSIISTSNYAPNILSHQQQMPPQSSGRSSVSSPPQTARTIKQRSSIPLLKYMGSVKRDSQGAIIPTTSTSGLPPELEKKITFVPDYSVTIQDDCTYLEVTSNTYLLAYKTTLISRGNKVQPDDPQPSHYASSDNVAPPSYYSSERIKEEDSPANGTIIRVGKDKVNVHKRSSSDSQSHTIQPPTEENNIFNATFSQLYDSNSDPEAALLPKT
uniref:CNNM transmembrane domain-containing protein n=1 Tax=Panagrolaimus sp. PS1159 TaxID=55785 RepID=A0AC35EZP2_9BILA